MQRGLVNHAVPADQLDAAVDELARKIISKSSVAVSTGKRMFYKQLEMGLEGAYEYAAETMACNMMAEDVGEGIDAFTAETRATMERALARRRDLTSQGSGQAGDAKRRALPAPAPSPTPIRRCRPAP